LAPLARASGATNKKVAAATTMKWFSNLTTKMYAWMRCGPLVLPDSIYKNGARALHLLRLPPIMYRLND
jgi:hypothetical protein